MPRGAQDGASARAWWAVAASGWLVVALLEGGIELGRIPPPRGGTGLVVAGVLMPAGAAAAAWCATPRAAAPARLGLAALLALLTWSAASIAWATAPDLAWLATNRLAVGVAAALAMFWLTPRMRDPARTLAIALAAGGAAVLAVALLTRILPQPFAPIVDTPRLAAPIGQANTLALIAAMAVPGALLLAADRRWRPAGAALTTAALLVVAMTGSRSGVLALAAVLVVAVWLFDDRPRTVAALIAGAVGAAIPGVLALGADAFTREPFLAEPSERTGIGLLLGGLVVAGIAVAIPLADAVLPAARTIARALGGAAGVVLAALVGLAIAGAILLAARSGQGPSGGAGLIRAGGNNRGDWWEQAWRGFQDAPLAGHGAGSFPLTHILEREIADETLRVRQPHQAVLELLTELGIVGALLGIVAVVAVAWAARRAGRICAPALCIVVAFLVQAQLDVPGVAVAATVPALAAAGAIFALAGDVGDPPERGLRTARTALTAVVALATVASCVWVWDAARQAGDALTSPAGPAVARGLSAADRNPLSISGLLTAARAADVTGDGAGAIDAAARATERQPDNPFAWECRVAVGGDTALAERRWRALDPQRDPASPARCQPGW